MVTTSFGMKRECSYFGSVSLMLCKTAVRISKSKISWILLFQILYFIAPTRKLEIGNRKSMLHPPTKDSTITQSESVLNDLFDTPNNMSLHDRQHYFNKLKKILLFNPFFNRDDYWVGFGHQLFFNVGCKNPNCYITNNRTLLGDISEFDAIVFHTFEFQKFKETLPTRRSPHQRYIMYIQESPLMDRTNYSSLKSFFNWTVTYRYDSDFVNPYAWITRKDDDSYYPSDNNNLQDFSYPKGDAGILDKIVSNLESGIKINRKLVVWAASNCYTSSNREELVFNLMNHIRVDIFGKCGNMECPKSKNSDCMKMMDQSYKFYLSFENSLCMDYVTEKFFKVFDYDMVPIVFGSADYSKIAPPKSYIKVEDFESLQAFVDYLNYLDKNTTAYAEYFEWKSYFKVNVFSRVFCHLCEALGDPNQPVKIYDDIDRWWLNESHCSGTRKS